MCVLQRSAWPPFPTSLKKEEKSGKKGTYPFLGGSFLSNERARGSVAAIKNRSSRKISPKFLYLLFCLFWGVGVGEKCLLDIPTPLSTSPILLFFLFSFFVVNVWQTAGWWHIWFSKKRGSYFAYDPFFPFRALKKLRNTTSLPWKKMPRLEAEQPIYNQVLTKRCMEESQSWKATRGMKWGDDPRFPIFSLFRLISVLPPPPPLLPFSKPQFSPFHLSSLSTIFTHGTSGAATARYS